MSVLLIKDDTDSGFEYLGQWNTLSSDSPNVERNTLHSTTEIGASASFTDIQGDAVAVYITVPMCPSTDAVIGRVSIDNGTPEDVRIGCNATAVEDGVAFWSFSKGRLPSSGRHRIVITNQGSVPLQLDSLKFGNFSLTLPTIFSSTPTKTDTSVVGSNTLITQTTTAYSASTSAHPLPLGPIIGGVLGGLVIILTFVFLLLRYKPHQRTERDPDETDKYDLIPTAFSIPPRSPPTSLAVKSSPDLPQTPTTASPTALSYATSDRNTSGGQSSSLRGSSANIEDISISPTPFTGQPNRRHFLSGGSSGAVSLPSGPQEVPPSYESIQQQSGSLLPRLSKQ